VSSSDFRQIALKDETGKTDRLFRAAISAFCSLTRPSRREIDQLEDLALPLFDHVSVESRRFASAALSECQYSPTALVRRLSDQTVDIAAPLLIRSNALTDIDLIALIGRHGLSHARAIARRPGLNPAIAQLAKALASAAPSALEQAGEPSAVAARPPYPASNDRAAEPENLSNADRMRNRLRTMMRPATEAYASHPAANEGPAAQGDFAALRSAALSGDHSLFQAALAEGLGITPSRAQSLVEDANLYGLSAALCSLGLTEEQAFLIVASLNPGAFRNAEAIRGFLETYREHQPGIILKRRRSGSAVTATAVQVKSVRS
jgi:uncharacterized protein (DUF2336 family)